MIIYSATKEKFTQDVLSGDIESNILEAFVR